MAEEVQELEKENEIFLEFCWEYRKGQEEEEEEQEEQEQEEGQEQGQGVE